MSIKEKYPTLRVPLDDVRKDYIDTLCSSLNKISLLPGVENFFQSFCYLILNDKFHRDVERLRKESGISVSALVSERPKSYMGLYKQTERYVLSSLKCSERYRPLIVRILVDYYLGIEPNELWVKSIEEGFQGYFHIVGGFDVPDPDIKRKTKDGVDIVSWTVYVYEKDNLTEFRKALEHYYSASVQAYFSVGTKENPYISGKQAKIRIIAEKTSGRVKLEFLTNPYTPTKCVLSKFDKARCSIRENLKKIKNSAPDNRARAFQEKIGHYVSFLDGDSVDSIIKRIYSEELGQVSLSVNRGASRKADKVRTNYKEVKRKVFLSYIAPLSF